MKKVFLFSLVVLLSCKINAVGLDVAYSPFYWAEHERQSTDLGVVAFTDAENQACKDENSAFDLISAVFTNKFNSVYPGKSGCQPGDMLSASGVNCQDLGTQAVQAAINTVPTYFTANPLLNKSLCVGGVCGPNGCVAAEHMSSGPVSRKFDI